jgi:hypothetical protein
VAWDPPLKTLETLYITSEMTTLRILSPHFFSESSFPFSTKKENTQSLIKIPNNVLTAGSIEDFYVEERKDVFKPSLSFLLLTYTSERGKRVGKSTLTSIRKATVERKRIEIISLG